MPLVVPQCGGLPGEAAQVPVPPVGQVKNTQASLFGKGCGEVHKRIAKKKPSFRKILPYFSMSAAKVGLLKKQSGALASISRKSFHGMAKVSISAPS